VVVELFSAEMADKAALLPGTKRLDGRRIEILAADMPEAYRSFRAAVTLARS
jgi:D-aminopeptidase